MRVAIAWQWKSEARKQADASAVVQDLDRCFASLAGEPLTHIVHEADHVGFAAIELRPEGFEAPFHETGADGWAFATEYPLNGARLVDKSAGEGVLRALARELGRGSGRLLKELYPPFTLIHFDEHSAELVVENDGLGQGQLFDYEDDHIWAVSNRIGAFRALGLELVPEPDDWAVRFTLGWFPRDTSGYRNVRHLAPGSRIAVGRGGVRRTRTDVISSWVHPESRKPDDCLDLARSSMETYLTDVRSLAPMPSVGLSGGWDSRAVTAVMRSQGSEFELRVRGHPERFDVRISSKLAQIADLPLRIKTKGGYPPDDPDAGRECIQRALRWQGGHMATLKHKTFLAGRPYLGRGVVNVMGQHSGIGKADFAVQIGADALDPSEYESRLVELLMQAVPPTFTESATERVRVAITDAYREADRYDLHGLHRLHFFFLNEYTRRWGAATVNAQAGVVITPFLNPDLIRAAYAFPPERIPEKPFHRNITRTHAPDWADVLYTDRASPTDFENYPAPSVQKFEAEDLPAWRTGRRYGKYYQHRYWKLVGWPLVAEALAEEGWWSEIFRGGGEKRDWYRPKGVADAIVISHLVQRSIGPEDPALSGSGRRLRRG